MIPGYVTLYKDNNEFVHLYFYKGYTDDNKFYYNDLDLSNCIYRYNVYKREDGAYEYIFYNKKIKSMTFNLVNYENKINTFKLNI